MTDQSVISKYERSIEAIKAGKNCQPASSQEVASYYVILASLRCLTADFGQVVTLGEKALNMTQDPYLVYNQSVTLSISGYFSKARATLDKVSEYDLASLSLTEDDGVRITSILQDTISLDRDVLSDDRVRDRFSYDVDRILEMREILSDLGISDSQALSMLDIAGDVLRSRNTFLAHDLYIHTNSIERYLSISLPVSLSASEIAEMEWECIGKVMEQYPEVPYSSFNIGFTSANAHG
ncbi:hypothetical protein [Ferriphaselus amnicola]|uniref:hypothetical protein n=1 Tax=Ferriphaselus amnicola TaxID=1188319 RepID=UPI0011AE9123|nr:hypothetical protein [Ferriphaselus amnicola]